MGSTEINSSSRVNTWLLLPVKIPFVETLLLSWVVSCTTWICLVCLLQCLLVCLLQSCLCCLPTITPDPPPFPLLQLKLPSKLTIMKSACSSFVCAAGTKVTPQRVALCNYSTPASVPPPKRASLCPALPQINVLMSTGSCRTSGRFWAATAWPGRTWRTQRTLRRLTVTQRMIQAAWTNPQPFGSFLGFKGTWINQPQEMSVLVC